MDSPSPNAPAQLLADYPPAVRNGQVKANGVEFSYLEDGPPDGPLALCLHGFPDTAHSFRHLLPALAEAGYHAVAPWLRGYAPTSLPADGIFHQAALGSDACALHDALGGDGRAVLVGHDWGAFAAYCAAPYEPQRWHKVVILSIPPPAAMAQAFLTYDQMRRSFYVFLFQLPLGDLALNMEDLRFVERLWADWSPGYDATWDVERVQESLCDAERRSAALGYYRSMFGTAPPPEQYAPVQAAVAAPPQPTLYLHGEDDGCFGLPADIEVEPLLAEGSVARRVARAGHFLHLERPDEVNGRILEFLSRS